MRLLDYASNIYSQNGEDGIIAKMLDLLPERDRWCVEFGAWDGMHFSNTRALVDARAYTCVMIEGDQPRFQDLVANANKGIIPINQSVGWSERDGLDSILAVREVPQEFDLLSIDIDGNDYHVWKAVSRYRPKIVVIEFNPTVQNEVDFVQIADRSVNQGCSLRALVNLGKTKGYELACVTMVNAIFIRSDLFQVLGISDNRQETLREEHNTITYLFHGYDGTIILRGRDSMIWHNVKLASRIKQLPRLWRTFPDGWNPLTRFGFRLYRKLFRA